MKLLALQEAILQEAILPNNTVIAEKILNSK